MAKDALFRNSIGGYNKDDVTRYIEELNIQYTDRGAELEGEIKQLKKELEAIPALKADKEKAEEALKELDVIKKENTDLSEAIKAQGKELEETNKSLTALTAEKEALELRVLELSELEEKVKNEKIKLDAEYNAKARELRVLTDENEALKASLNAEKEEFERRAEEMLIQIQDQAKAVIERANKTAELIVEDAKKKAQEATVRVQDTPANTSSHAPSKRKDSFSDILDNHKSKMDSFFAAITKTLMGESK